MPLNRDVLWYKDAIIYQVHVRTFHDSNGDGIGDFQGLEGKLDYLQKLGINAIWLMPFFPSPLRDDGYDISDYNAVHSSYGTLEGFKSREVRRTIHAAIGMSGATPTAGTRALASSFLIQKRPTGRGTRRQNPSIGIASSVTNPISTTTILRFGNRCGR